MSIYTNDLTDIVTLIDGLSAQNVASGTIRTGDGHTVEFSLDAEAGEHLVIDALTV